MQNHALQEIALFGSLASTDIFRGLLVNTSEPWRPARRDGGSSGGVEGFVGVAGGEWDAAFNVFQYEARIGSAHMN